MRSSSAMIAQFMTIDEPPCAMNGVVRPVSGMSRVTPPTTTKTCRANENGEADGEQLAEGVAADQRDAQAALDDEAVDDAGSP